jgi:prepilin-type processing-associated H-X9-DG protein
VLCAGSTVFNPSTDPLGENLNGMFYPLSKTKITDVTDGTSNTLMSSEIILVPDVIGVQFQPGPSLSLHDLRGRYYNTWQGNVLFTALQPPNTSVGDTSTYCRDGIVPQAPCILSATNTAQYARSFHTGGVNAGLADGSVRFISNNINLLVYQALSTRSGGEAISGDY